MLFPRLRAGRRQPRGIDWRFIKLMIIVVFVLIAVSQIWQAFSDRMSAASVAGSAASAPAHR